MSWKEILVNILTKLGGKARLMDIYLSVVELALDDSFLTNSIQGNFRSSIRYTLQMHPNLFYQENKGSGIWMLVEKNQESYKKPLLFRLNEILLDNKLIGDIKLLELNRFKEWKLVKYRDKSNNNLQLSLSFNQKSVFFSINSKQEYEDFCELTNRKTDKCLLEIIEVMGFLNKSSEDERHLLYKQLNLIGKEQMEIKAIAKKDKGIQRSGLSINKIKIKLTPSRKYGSLPAWKLHNRIPIPKEIRAFFPEYKKNFYLDTDIGTIKTYVTAKEKISGDPKRLGQLIIKGLRPWFNHHSDLKPGDSLIISELKEKTRYKLEIEKSYEKEEEPFLNQNKMSSNIIEYMDEDIFEL